MPGKEFDALIIDLNASSTFVNNSKEDKGIQGTLQEKLQRFIYSGDDRNIISVYVKGRNIK
jgi:guanine deaminase